MTNTRVGLVPGHNQTVSGLQRAYPYLFAPASTLAAALGTTTCLNGIISDIRFKTTSTGETIKVSASKDNSAYTDLIPVDESTGLPYASANLASGNYVLKIKNNAQWRFFKFTKSATASAGVVVLTCALTRPPSGSYL